MQKILLISLVLVPAMCSLAGTTCNDINRNPAVGATGGSFIPCGITLTSAPGTDDQTVCINTPITDITYSTSTQTQAVTFSGLPAGVTGSYDAQAHLATISGTPTETGVYTYTVTASGMPCSQSYRTGIITVKSDATIALTSDPGTTNQTVCINTPITNITYFISGAGTGADVTGLPPGVTGAYIPTVHTYRIMGTPTAAGTFNYTVTTTGGTCAQATTTGTITVNPDATIALTSPPGSNSQIVCVNTPIANITYSIGGSGTGATATGLPPGVAGVYNAGVFTISGAPTGADAFSYTITTTGACPHSATGTITVKPDATIVLTSDPGTTNQTICINTPITNITYFISGGGTGADVNGLPPGVYGAYIPTVHTYRIMGTPTAAGTFNYTITTTGTCVQATATGTITVNPDATIALTSPPGSNSQIVCVNTPIANITYSIGGSGTGATATGLPPGVAGVYNAGVFTISGAPTGAGAFSYTVTATGICPQSATGTITVKPDATITLTSAPATTNQTVCPGDTIVPITYIIGGGGTGAIVTGLPAGVIGTYLPSFHFFSIHGQSTTPGTYNFTVTTTGTCLQVTATGTLTVPFPATITLTSAIGTDNQTFCLGESLSVITYVIAGGGSLGTLSGLPEGVNWSYNSGVLTLHGTPVTAGSYIYSVTTIGTFCGALVTGSITVLSLPILDCLGQCVSVTCINEPMEQIVYHVEVPPPETLTLFFEGLPPWVSWMYFEENHHLYLYGMPPDTGLWDFTVTAAGSNCEASHVGRIIVRPIDGVTLVSAPGTDNQTVCLGQQIEMIRIQNINFGSNNYPIIEPNCSGLSSFMDCESGFAFQICQIKIHGSPDDVGIFQGSVSQWVFCGIVGISEVYFTIEVLPVPEIELTSGLSNQSVHCGENLIPIVFSIGDGALDVNVDGLAPGLASVYEPTMQLLTIYGAPTYPFSSQWPYTVHATGTLCEDSFTGVITILPPEVVTIGMGIVTGSECYEAGQSIIVAGSGQAYTVAAGGSVKMVSGQNILMMPLTRVVSGGYLLGCITNETSGSCFCPLLHGLPNAAVPEDLPEAALDSNFNFRIYPNPTTGAFTLELASEPGKSPVSFHCYNLMGSLVMVEKIYSGQKHEFTLANQAPGIYLLRVTRDGETGVRKIIRQ